MQSVRPSREVVKLLSFGWQVVSSSESLSCGHGEVSVKIDRSMLPVSVYLELLTSPIIESGFLCSQTLYMQGAIDCLTRVACKDGGSL